MKKINILIGLFTILLDQISKIVISNNISLNNSVTIIKDFLYLTYVHNKGAAWSILSGYNILLILITIASIYLIYIYTKEYNEIFKYILFGGIIGNLIDRLIFGYVRDFIDIRIFNYNYPIFNISDICIFIGILYLIIKIVKEEKDGSRNK